MSQWEQEMKEQLLDDRRLEYSAEDGSSERELELFERLEKVADILADAGIIHNTPAAKLSWIEKG